MGRSPLWRSIHDNLRAEMATGHYPPGTKLPTEAELAARFGVNRHTVRQALAALAEGGLVHPRRGAGVFVTAKPADYALGRRVRFQQNLAAQGRLASRRFTRMETRPSTPKEAEARGMTEGTEVQVVEGILWPMGCRWRPSGRCFRQVAFRVDPSAAYVELELGARGRRLMG